MLRVKMNPNLIRKLNDQQKIVYTAMMMPVSSIPDFPSSGSIHSLGITIHELFKNKTLTHISLNSEGEVICY